MSARVAVLVVAIAAIAIAGAGCSYNPGSLPWILPPGPILQTHAKPRFGYFHNFDRNAHKLDVKPSGQANAPLGSQIVLVATVYDKEGQARRDRRVEWMIDGPGHIVEADESGVYAGRGYKVDNNYAVTYSSYIPKKITRGNDDPKDDVTIEAGQTFIVVSSAVPGETVVTAYAPEVYNWDNNHVTTKICWGDGRFSFPQPVSVRIGGETTLATSVNANTSDSQSSFRVRYRVIDGPAAVLVSNGGDDNGTSLTGSGGKETETLTDSNGEAAVRLVQRDPKVGKTRVAIEVVKPAENGTGPGTVVGRRETVVEWTNPNVKLKVDTPPVASSLGTFPVTVTLDNISGVDSKDARVRVTLSDGATLARSEPPPSRVDEKGGLIFDLPPINGKSKQAVALQVKPARVGNVAITAEAVTGDGLQANTNATTRIENGKLQMLLESPPIALTGEHIPARISVTNAGAAAVENVTVWAQFDNGLQYASGRSPVELTGGTIASGETKTFDLPLSASAAGRYGIRATATGDGNLTASAEPLAVEVRRAELAVSLVGPKLVYLNQEVNWSLTVANRGDSSVSSVVVRATLPPELKITAADGGTIASDSVEWKLDTLKSGEQKSFKLAGDAIQLAPQASISVTVSGDAINNASVEGKAEAVLAVIGTPALGLELTAPPGAVEVGKRARYQIRVTNQGTVSARKVDITAFASAELKPVRGNGVGEARIDGTGRVAFPTVDEIQPGQTLLFVVEVEAAKPGDARFRAEVSAPNLKNPLKEEQATRVTGK